LPLTSTQLENARFEIERLQDIVARHEEHTFKIRGWLYTVLGALTVSLYTESIALAPLAFSELCIVTIALFLAWELVQRSPKRKAIDRVRDVEKMIRLDSTYDGPKIADTFINFKYNPLTEFKISLVWLPYLVALLATIALALAKYAGILHPLPPS
jgi:hypothetical protein